MTTEEGMATHSSILACRIPIDRGDWRARVHVVAEWHTTEAADHARMYSQMITVDDKL